MIKNIPPTIQDVKKFWNENPLFSGELELPVGSKAWFEKLDTVQFKDVFNGDLSDVIDKNLENKKILEVGCGPGFLARQIGMQTNSDYTAIDISEKAIELAMEGQKIFDLRGHFEIGNAEALSFNNNTFDHIISIGVIHHTVNTQKCIDEFYRVLKPGGTGVCAVYYKNIFFKNKFVFNLAIKIATHFNFGLAGRGRDKMWSAPNISEFIRMYDGEQNPIGRAYSKSEVYKMFSNFRISYIKTYYFPTRALKVNLPIKIRKVLSKYFGFLILIKFQK